MMAFLPCRYPKDRYHPDGYWMIEGHRSVPRNTHSSGQRQARHIIRHLRDNIRIKPFPIWIAQVILLATLLFKSLHNGEFARVMNVLHDDPIDLFSVLFVDSRSLNELQFNLFDAFGVVFAVEVADECVDHCCR